MPRLFTGLEIPADIALALSLKRGGLPGARWVDPENYHITLRFIGDVEGHVANEAADALEALANSVSFTVRITDLGVFGNNRPHSLFAGIDPSEPLLRLQAAQERVLQRIGLAAEARKYTPHVTLARLRGTSSEDAASFIAGAGRFTPLEFPVDRFVLYSSRDSVGGGPYVVELAYPLAPDEDVFSPD